MRRFFSILLIILACFTSLAALTAIWADQQILDEKTFVTTTSKALASPEVSNALAGEATDQLYDRVDVPALLEGVLPEQVQPLAPLAAASLRSPIQQGVAKALASGPVQDLEREAIKQAYPTAIAALQGKPGLIIAEGDAFKVDLSLVALDVASKIGLEKQAESLFAPGSLQVELIQSKYISQAEAFVHWLPLAAFWLPLLTIIFAVSGVALAARRYGALIGLGLGFAAAALSLFLAGSQVDSQIETNLDGFSGAFASELWRYWIVDLNSFSLALGLIGLLTISAGLLASPWLLSWREYAAMALNRGPWLAFLAVVIVAGALSVVAGLSPWPVILAVAGLCAWRYQMEEEGLPKDTAKFDQFFGLAVSPESPAPKPAAKPAAKKPAAKPAEKKPVAKPAAKKSAAKPAEKKPVAKKPAAKPRSNRTT